MTDLETIAKAKAHADALEAAATVRRAEMAQRAEFERTRLQPFLGELAALCNAHRVRLVDVNKHFDGPGPVYLYVRERDGREVWGVTLDDGYPQEGEYERSPSEELPGDDRKIDATAIARRLIAALASA